MHVLSTILGAVVVAAVGYAAAAFYRAYHAERRHWASYDVYRSW